MKEYTKDNEVVFVQQCSKFKPYNVMLFRKGKN